MQKIGKFGKILLNDLASLVKPGINTKILDDYAMNFIKKNNLKASCLGYKGKGKTPYPAAICTSVNHVVCHGIPSENHVLKEGDILSIDLVVAKDNMHADTCLSLIVGQKTSLEKQNLVNLTKKAMEIGIQAIKINEDISIIGNAIEKFVKNFKINHGIVEDYCGHGIGEKMHEDPYINHVATVPTGVLIKPGMFFTVEPMITNGTNQIRLLNDDWTVITKDYSDSAHFEHTIAITENGYEVLT